MSTERVLIGVLGGIAIGATLGVLFAPDKGSTTRRKIVQKGDDYVHDLEDHFSEMVKTLTKKIEALADEAIDAVENGKKSVEQKMSH